MFVCLNGKFLKAREAKVSIFDHGFLYGDGVYETLRTYGGKVWQIQEHLKRLERSGKRVELDLPISLEVLEKWVRKLVEKNGFQESRIRVTLTRGISKPTLLIQSEKLHLQPESVYKNGIKTMMVYVERVAPEVKSISMLPMIIAQQCMKHSGAYEGLLIDNKRYVREGTITNVFMVKNGVIFTPKSRILKGTTRNCIIKIARKMKMRLRVEDFTVRKLKNADELFLTNALRGIIPVRRVDDHIYGRPGPVTKQLMRTFDDAIRKTCR